jgi:hypothetical protein
VTGSCEQGKYLQLSKISKEFLDSWKNIVSMGLIDILE